MNSDFPYAMHVETIRKALWRPRSRAAVMIGSGFSRNADAITSAAPPFPLWGDIVTRLQEVLDSKNSKNTDPLRLAEEYEYAASRTALDDLLLEMVPDTQYQPGPLHELLLSLPWSDVFTVNYDTLIERTRTKVHEIKYSVVLTPADIARSERPRIVKLHGSFPSHRPFIFTAEDYRKYPKDFAPFVNMVQQSIMENVFCMIGFSGNDPNFIQWIGWVRDQLGPASPKIYLCDVLDMNPAKDRLYQSMRVVPIDLGPLVPRSTWTEELRRPKALEWFLASLHQGKQLDLSKWPRSQEATQPRFQIAGLPPPLPNPDLPAWMKLPPLKKPETLSAEDLKVFTERWSIERKGYPGWVVIPESNRERLLRDTKPWLSAATGAQVLKLLDMGSALVKLESLYELTWRLRHCLIPLPDWLFAAVTNALERLNPKPGLIKLKGLAAEPETPSGNTDELTEKWVSLAFAQVNHAWQHDLGGGLSLWIERLKDVVTLKSEWQAQWHHEQCWYHLLWLDEQAVCKALEQWPAREGLPFWEARRAALLAALGDTKEALHLAETALVRVRQSTATASLDYINLSEEGWLLALISTLELEIASDGGQRREEFIARLRELGRYHCNPLEDGNQRTQRLLESDFQKSSPRKYGFDPGARISSRTWSNNSKAGDWSLLQMFHDGALPIRCGTVANYGKGLASTILRIWPASPRLAIGLGVLGERFEELKKTLGRVDVVLLDRSTADSLYDWIFKSLSQAIFASAPSSTKGSRKHGLRYRLLRGGPEVLSRLTLQLSPEQLQAAFELAMKMYSLESFWDARLHRLVDMMLRRLLVAASSDQVFSWLPQLLALPIPGHEDFAPKGSQDWMEPLEFLSWNPDWRHPTDAEKASWSKQVDRLIHLVQDGIAEVRETASLRLVWMADLKGLTEKQSKAFIGALWSKTDSTGFPSNVGFAPWVLLKISAGRQPGEAQRAVSRHLLEQAQEDFHAFIESVDLASAYPWSSPEEQKTQLQWTPAEASVLLQKIRDGWSHQRAKVALEEDSEVAYSIKQALDLLGKVVLLRLDPADLKGEESVRTLLSEWEELGFSSLSVLPALLTRDPSQVEAFAKRIHRALSSAYEHEITGAALAIVRWTALAREKRVPPAPPQLLEGWVVIAAYRRQPGLAVALQGLSVFIDQFGEELTEQQIQALCTGLEYLFHETSPVASLEEMDELALDAEERIALRWPASQLAASLAVLHQKRALSPPPIIEEWRKVGATDTLPEVRLAWKKPHVGTA